MTYYRLVFKDGTHSAWSTNYELIKEDAKFFNVTIEKWVIEI